MRPRSLCVVLLALTLNGVARAEEGFGVGLIIGDPTGISAKQWISPRTAIDAAAAWSFSGRNSFQFHADYLIHDFELLKTDPDIGRTALYLGIGGRFRVRDSHRHSDRGSDSSFGVRIPLGITFLFAKMPLDVFGEIVPIFDVVPDTEFGLNGGIGVRFYFR